MKILFSIIFLFMLTTSVSQSIIGDEGSQVRVKQDKPTVYLDYFCRDKDSVYLRMYNNTIWHISVKTNDLQYPSKTPITLRNGLKTYAAPNDKDISLQYVVEKYALPWENVKVPKVSYSDSSFSGWIASQDSVFFSVPTDYLRKDLQVVVRFNYEWEITRKGYTINDPEHRVSFRGLDLLNTKSTACEKH